MTIPKTFAAVGADYDAENAKPRDGGPAFPEQRLVSADGVSVADVEPGMSLRDYFAGQALPAIITDPAIANGQITDKQVVRCAYRIADAMLAQRRAKETA